VRVACVCVCVCVVVEWQAVTCGGGGRHRKKFPRAMQREMHKCERLRRRTKQRPRAAVTVKHIAATCVKTEPVDDGYEQSVTGVNSGSSFKHRLQLNTSLQAFTHQITGHMTDS